MKELVISLMLAFTFQLNVVAQDFLADNEYHYQLMNGLQFMLIENDTATDVTINLTFRTGTVVAKKESSGLAYFYGKLLANKIKANFEAIGLQNPSKTVIAHIDFEHISIQLTCTKRQFEHVLKGLYLTVSNTDLDEELIQKTKNEVNLHYEQSLDDPYFRLRSLVSAKLWKEYYTKRKILIPIQDSSTQQLYTKLQQLQDYYFCPKNTFISIKGNLEQRTFFELINTTYKNWERCTFNYAMRYPVQEYKVLRFSTQLLDENKHSTRPIFNIAIQGPQYTFHKKSVYASIVLSKLISSPQTKLYHQLTDTTGIDTLFLKQGIFRYSSQFSFVIYPDTANMALAYQSFWNIISQMRDSSFILPKDIEIAKQEALKEFNTIKNNNINHLDMLSNFWASASINAYNTYEDSINAVTDQDIQNFIDYYFFKNHFVAGFSIKHELINRYNTERFFTTTQEDIKNYAFEFLTNTATFSDKSQDSILNSLIQFLKINPTLKIKVNGLSNSSELLKIKDVEMFNFFNSLENFIIYPKPSKNIRLDIYRSMIIIKQLIEAGISEMRLFGTGFLNKKVRSTEHSDENVYCTQFR